MGSLRYSVSSPSPARTANPGAPGHGRFPACARRMGLCRRARSFPPPPRPAGHMVAVRAFAVPRGGVSASRFAPVRAPARQARPARPAARPVRWIVPIISARAAVRQPPARRPAPAFCPPSVRCASRADRFCVPAPAAGIPPACTMMLPPLHVRPPPRARRLILRPRPALLRPVPRRFPSLCNDAAAAPCLPAPARPPCGGQNPAVPAYFFHRSGPARGGSPPAPSCPARAAGRGNPPRISGGFAHSPPRRPGAPIHINRLQKNGKYSWNVHCNFSQSSPFCSIMNHRHSRGPGAHARRAAASGARFPDRLFPLYTGPVSHPRFSVCRERAPSPRPAGAGRMHRLFRLYVPCMQSGCAHRPRPACSII